MLTEQELASMRETMNDSLAGTATVEVSSFVSDGGGGGTTTFAAQGTFDCRIAPTTGAGGNQEFIAANRLHPDSEWVVTFPHDAEVTANDQLRHDNRVFTVLAVTDPRTFAVSLRAEVKEIT